MAMDDEWRDWHLTPRGWKAGSKSVHNESRTHVDPPQDRVKTVRYREIARSPYSDIRTRKTTTWTGDEEKVVHLEEEYGSCPEMI